MKDVKMHWTQLPKNKAKLRKSSKKGAVTRSHNGAPAPPPDFDHQDDVFLAHLAGGIEERLKIRAMASNALLGQLSSRLAKIIGAMFLVLVMVRPSQAQRISPVVSECGHKCNGSFSIANGGLIPFISTVTYANFEPTPNGRGKDISLSALVKIDSTSARVSPRGEHTFNYSVSCAFLPCAVRFTTSQVTGRTADGLQVRIVLPHVIYICEKSKNCRKNILTAAGVGP